MTDINSTPTTGDDHEARPVTYLRVRALPEQGFYRGGIRWTQKEQFIRIDDNEALAKEIEDERQLSVSRVEPGQLTPEQRTEADSWGESRKPPEKLPPGTPSTDPAIEDTITATKKPVEQPSTDVPEPRAAVVPAVKKVRETSGGVDTPDPLAQDEASGGAPKEDEPVAGRVTGSAGGDAVSTPHIDEGGSSGFFGGGKKRK